MAFSLSCLATPPRRPPHCCGGTRQTARSHDANIEQQFSLAGPNISRLLLQVEAIESSPRAHASLDASPPAVDGGETPPAEPTPLVAQLAGAALLPVTHAVSREHLPIFSCVSGTSLAQVMQTTLAVSETDARWRLVQLIARLLARLGAAHCERPLRRGRRRRRRRPRSTLRLSRARADCVRQPSHSGAAPRTRWRCGFVPLGRRRRRAVAPRGGDRRGGIDVHHLLTPPSLLRAALELVDAATRPPPSMQRAPSIRLAHVIPRWALVYMLSHSHCLGYTSKLCGCGVPCSPAWRRQWAPLRAARSQPSRRGPAVVSLGDEVRRSALHLKAIPQPLRWHGPRTTPRRSFPSPMLVVDWYLLHDRQYGAAGSSFVVTHAAALAALLDAALITNVGGRGAIGGGDRPRRSSLRVGAQRLGVAGRARPPLVVLIGGAADAAADEHSDYFWRRSPASWAAACFVRLRSSPPRSAAPPKRSASLTHCRGSSCWHRGHKANSGRAAQTPLPKV